MIELRNVSKYFNIKNNKKYILKDSSLIIPSNVNIAILGKKGVGRTTLLKILGKMDSPSSGQIISDKSFSWIFGLIGGFIPNMTAKKNIKFICKLYGKSKKEIERVIDDVGEISELKDYLNKPIKTYSSIMLAKLKFGLSLSFNFDYLLIDERLFIGNTKFKERSKEIFFKKIEKCNILLVSNDMKLVREVCDVGIIIHNGQIYFFEKIDDAIERHRELNKKDNKK